jgi:folate-dependent phosphoribosylglycinamide formyltransferase PurN
MKIGILCTASLNKFNFEVLSHIVIMHKAQGVCCFIDTRPGKTDFERFVENAREWRGSYVLLMSVYKLFRKKFKRIDTKSFCQSRDLCFFEMHDPYSEELQDILKGQKTDILVHLSGFDSVITKPLLETTPLGVLAYHHGDIHEYRGQPPAFWELYYGESSVVSTILKLNEWENTGMKVAEKETHIKPSDSLLELRNRIFSSTTDLMAKALDKFGNEDYKPEAPNHYGTLYTYPKGWEWLVLQYRILRRRAKPWLAQLPKINLRGFGLSELRNWER